jgi:tRNA pseudouridine38-40 synthase
VRSAAWRLEGDGREAVFEICGDSFLYNMVRVAVGSMVDVAQGRLALDDFAAGLEAGERSRMGRTAPARGLALVAVEY